MGEASDPGERTPDTASDVAPDAGRLKASRTPRPLHGGRYFFLGMGLLCLALGGVGLAIALPEALAESRLALRTIPTVGTVIETRITTPDSSRPKYRQSEGLVEYTFGARAHRQWIRCSPRQPGETLPLWYDPAAQAVAGEPPNPVGCWLRLPPLSFFALLGLYLSAVMIRLLLKGKELTTGPPYPDMTPLTRSALLVFGGLGVLALVGLLLVAFAFATVDPPTETPTDRWDAIQFAIGSNGATLAMAFSLLTGLLVLCVKASGSDPQLAHNTGRHVLISSGLAMAAIAGVLSLVVIGFRFP